MAAKLPNFVVTDGAATTTWEQTVGRPRVCLIGLKDVKCVIPGVFDLFEAVSNRMVSMLRWFGFVSHIGYHKLDGYAAP